MKSVKSVRPLYHFNYFNYLFLCLLLVCVGCANVQLDSGHSREQIRIAVLIDHIERRLLKSSDSTSGYAFFFVRTNSKSERSQLEEYFAGCHPPLLFDENRLLIRDNRKILERVTGGEIMVFGVEIFFY